MERYTPEERGIIVTAYLTNFRSVVLTQREFRRQFPHRSPPCARTIKRLAERLVQTGSTRDVARSGRPRNARSIENVAAVAEDVQESPQTSTRQRCTQFGISRRSLRRILVEDLKMFPYKVQTVHQLLPADSQARLTYSHALLNLVQEEDDFVSKIIMSDEAHFHLSGYVNKQNLRFWGTENPHEMHEKPLHPLKVTVWCGICSERVIGPYFFENADGTTVTVTGERYRQMLNEFCLPKVAEFGLEHCWFQQDGATSHTAQETMEILRHQFPGRVISRFGDLNWPARSPDLTVPDFFLWGFLKSRVYRHKLRTLQALKANIEEEINNLEPDVLRATIQNAVKRAQMCINSGGGHLTDIIFST